jgi:hypothetical protein
VKDVEEDGGVLFEDIMQFKIRELHKKNRVFPGRDWDPLTATNIGALQLYLSTGIYTLGSSW